MAKEAASGAPHSAGEAHSSTGETHSSTGAEGGAHGAGHEVFLGLDSYGWVAVAFLLFVALLWKVGAFKMLLGSLDARADKVRSDFAEAAALKAEAEALRAKAAAEAAQAQVDANAMLANAEAEARRIVEQATRDAETAIARRTRLAEDRIAAEARSAEADLRARAADITVKAARALLAEGAASGELVALTDAAISTLDKR